MQTHRPSLSGDKDNMYLLGDTDSDSPHSKSSRLTLVDHTLSEPEEVSMDDILTGTTNSRKKPSSKNTADIRGSHWSDPVLLLSTLWVITATSGLAVALIVWFIRHSTQRSVSEIWEEGAFLLDEGTYLEGGFPAARLTGLTIASASSIAMGTVTPVLLMLYAYRSTHLWLKAREAEYPTPLQYGLTIESLGAAGIISLFNTGKYLLWPSGRRQTAAYMLKEAFCVSILTYLLAHMVGALDLWIHSTAATVTKQIEVSINDPSQYSVSQIMCLTNSYPPPLPSTPCALPLAPQDVEEHALSLSSNASDSFIVIFPGNGSGIAALTTQGASDDAFFRMSTFGARASCASYNPVCDESNLTYVVGNNISAPSLFPVPIDVTNPTLSGWSPILSFPSNVNGSHTVVSFTDLLGYPSNVTEPGPYTLWLQLWWPVPSDIDAHNFSCIFGTDADYSLDSGTMIGTALAMCDVSYYNVTLDYQNGSYSLADEVPSERFLSDGFSGALRANIFNNVLLNELQPLYLSEDISGEDRMSFLTQEMSRLATASAGVIANQKGPTIKQSNVENRILGRYPFIPVVSLIILLFFNSLFAVVICVLTSTSRVNKAKVPGTNEVSVLDPARLRLASPLAQIADVVRVLDPEAVGTSNETDAMAMFNEKVEARQVCFGDHENSIGETIFGVWKKKNGGEKV